ncbi:MAG: MATE family efflux transporter [Cellulosilyticum sp.]|nr:MATE family efflux transporter [Cellulosilyticum sp.]
MKDMTQGNPTKLIIGFAIPMLIGNIFQQVYNVVDTLVVGRYLGEEALAGVGSTGTLNFFLLSLVMGLCNGAGLVVAQCFGAKNNKKMKETVVALCWVVGILTILISGIGYVFCETFLQLLDVPENVIGYSIEYLQIIFIFLVTAVVYNGTAAILRSTGDSKTPLYSLVVSCSINVVLDIVFVVELHLGVSGVAYATVIAQFVSAMINLVWLLHKRKVIGLVDMNWKPERTSVEMIIKTGFPSAFQSCMISLGGMSVQRLINSFGSSVMAAYVAANRIDSVAIQVIVSIGTALSVFTGQNMGTNNFERIREGLYKTLIMMLGASISIAAAVLVFRYQLMGFFLDKNASPEILEIGATYLSIIGIAYIIAGIMQSYQNVIRGAGDVNTCMVAGLTELAGRIIFAYLLSATIGVTGIWIATPISWGCGCVIPVVRYYSGKWKQKKLI